MNDIKLRKLNTEYDLQYFGELKKELVHMHNDYANTNKIKDTKSLKYSFDEVVASIKKDNYEQYIILFNGLYCGILETIIQESDIKEEIVCTINIIYVLPEFQNNGICSTVINELFEKYSTLELEAWYDLPSIDLYRKIGFRNKFTTMILEK